MKPILKYTGGKSKELPFILPHVPAFKGRYMEPFLGGGALFFHLEPERSVINDINVPLINFYKGVRDDYPLVREELDELETLYLKNRKTFEARKARTPDDKVEDPNKSLYYLVRDMLNGKIPRTYSHASLYYFINKTAYSGIQRTNSKGEFNVPYGKYKNFNTSLLTEDHASLLAGAEIMNGDYTTVFDKMTADDFMFLDPPYDTTFSNYGNKDGFDAEEHERLAHELQRVKGKFLMVIGKTPLTWSLYGGMVHEEYGKKYAVNLPNRVKPDAVHMVVRNY